MCFKITKLKIFINAFSGNEKPNVTKDSNAGTY